MPTPRQGVQAIAEVIEDRLQQEQVEQYTLDLIMPQTRFEPGTPEHDRLITQVRKNHLGRPPGARNVATKYAVELVRRLFGDPLMERSRVLAHTPETLAAELQCSKLEAFELIDKIRADICQFVYPRLAPVDARGAAVVPTFNLNVSAGGPSAQPLTGAVGMSGPAIAWDDVDVDIDETEEEQTQQPQASARENGGT